MTTTSLLSEILATLKAQQPAKEVMNAKEVADYLGISTSYLSELTADNKIPFVKIGTGKGRNLFRKVDVDKWLEEHTVHSATDLLHLRDGRRKAA